MDRWSRLAIVVALLFVAAIRLVGAGPVPGPATASADTTGVPAPNVSGEAPIRDRLPGVDGQLRAPSTSSPRDYTYLNPAELLRESPAPDALEVVRIGEDYKKYPPFSRERAVARWNVRLAKYRSDSAKYEQGTLRTRSGKLAAKPVQPTWDDWLANVWIPNQGKPYLGDAYVDYVIEQFGLGGNHGWRKEGQIPDAPEGRRYDLINYELGIAYEIKSGDSPESGQLLLDKRNIAEMASQEWQIGYIFGGPVTDTRLHALRDAGLLVHAFPAEAIPVDTNGRRIAASASDPSAQIMRGPAQRPTTGSMTNVLRDSPASEERAAELAEEASVLGADEADTSTSGGIDFTSLELRSLTDTSSDDGAGAEFTFSADVLTGDDPTYGGLRFAQQASDAFFTWLALPTDRFWVNLNPDEPDRIIDAQFDDTEAGQILLRADLQLKKTTAALIHPDSALGARFWNSLRGMDGSSNCLSFRTWIVPAPAKIRVEQDTLYILDAPLGVEAETDHLATPGVTGSAGCRSNPTVDRHNQDVYRSLILPEIEAAVNRAPEYADLRRVYHSRVAAQWIRERAGTGRTAYSEIIDSGDVSRWAGEPWNPLEVFQQYVDSYKNGEFNVTHETRSGDVIQTRTYVFGGVDFSASPSAPVSDTTFARDWSHVSDTVTSAVSAPISAPGEGDLWLGGRSLPDPELNGVAAERRNTLLRWGVIGGLCLATLVPVLVQRVRNRAAGSPRRIR
ncbi:hypothetical protein ACWEKT_19395 [Nocardia takedensis]